MHGPTPRIAIDVALRKTPAGVVRFESRVDHAISVHAGPPVHGSCQRSGWQYVTTRGELSIVPEGAFDECFQDSPSDALEMRIPGSLIRLTAEEMGLDPARVALEPQYGIRDRQIEHIAWALEEERGLGDPSGRLYRESLGLALAAHLLARFRVPTARSRSRSGKLGLSGAQRARVIEYIETNLAGDISLPRLARVAGASCSHFRVLFKQSMGVPVHEYIIQRRVERARRLLLEGDLPASKIALDAGFSHQSHMARWVRRILGVPPAAITRRHRS